MSAPHLKVGDKVRIKNIEGLSRHAGILEYTDREFEVVEVDNDMSDEFQGIALRGVMFLTTNHDVELVR